jgi:hypothetical protein
MALPKIKNKLPIIIETPELEVTPTKCVKPMPLRADDNIPTDASLSEHKTDSNRQNQRVVH